MRHPWPDLPDPDRRDEVANLAAASIGFLLAVLVMLIVLAVLR